MSSRNSRREWDLLTSPYCAMRFGSELVVGEVPIRTAGGRQPRYVDAIVLRQPGDPGIVHLHDIEPQQRPPLLERLRHGRLVALQTKIERVGFSVLGQALMSVELVRDRYDTTSVSGIALGTATESTLARILGTPRFAGVITIDVLAGEHVSRATREAPKASELLEQAEAALVANGYVRAPQLRLTTDEAAEAIFVSDAVPVRGLDDLRSRDVIVIHTIGKATNLPIVGHAVFSARIVAEYEPRTLRTIVLTRKHDSTVEVHARSYGVETYGPDDLPPMVVKPSSCLRPGHGISCRRSSSRRAAQ